MRGIVEIYKGNTLILREDNLVVDGASKTLADILTTSPTLSGITTASSILDTSNYTIQAISFGKGPVAYGRNSHYYTSGKSDFIDTKGESCLITSALPTESSSTYYTSGYKSDDDLASFPSPLDLILQRGTQLASSYSAVDSYQASSGQNQNFIPSAHSASVSASLGFDSSAAKIVGSMLGCYPDGSSAGGTDFYMFSSVGGVANTLTANLIHSGTYNGTFNEASSMDQNGYVGMIMSSVQNAGYSLSSSFSGLTLSAGSNFSSTGEIMYEVMIASGDARSCHLYGGITKMGLWTIDVPKSLLLATPPFNFSSLNTNRVYRLFSTKTLNSDITAVFPQGLAVDEATKGTGIPTVEETDDIKISWTLKFL